MIIKTISVTYGRKINLGNYNSAEISVTAWADIDNETEDPQSCFADLWALAKEQVKTQAIPLVNTGQKAA